MKKLSTLAIALFAMMSLTAEETKLIHFDGTSLTPQITHESLVVSEISNTDAADPLTVSIAPTTYGVDEERSCLQFTTSITNALDKASPYIGFYLTVPAGKVMNITKTDIIYQKPDTNAKNSQWVLYENKADTAIATIKLASLVCEIKNGNISPMSLPNAKANLNVWQTVSIIPSTDNSDPKKVTTGEFQVAAGKYYLRMGVTAKTAGTAGSVYFDDIAISGTITDAATTSITTTENDGLTVHTADHLLNVTLKEAADVTVYTMTGNAIARQVGATQAEFSLPQGVYMVRAISGTNSMVRKVIVR